jgi:hypothetical protein
VPELASLRSCERWKGSRSGQYWQELQQIERLSSTDFAENDPIWPVTEVSFQQLADTHRWNAVLGLASFKAHKVVMVHLDFGSVFDEQDSLVQKR